MKKRTVSNNAKVTKEEVEKIRAIHEYISCWNISKARSLIRNLSQKKIRRLTSGYQELGIKPAIFFAIKKHNAAFVEFLVKECHADIEEQLCDEKVSPLEFAHAREEYDILDFLLRSGADPTRLISDGKTIVCPCRITRLSLRTLQILADHGADFNTTDEHGSTCLMSTVRSLDHLDCCRLLLNKGIDVKLADYHGTTALHFAVKGEYPDTVKLLLQWGADPCFRNNEGLDPLHLACIDGFSEIVDLLLQTVEDVTRHIESYQLLGSFSKKRTAMSAWRKAVKLYSKIPNRPSPVKLNTPFGIAVEATSLSELDDLTLNRDLLFMQSVVINRKIFGPAHSMFFKSIRLSAAKFWELNLFDKWLQMLTYLLVQTSSLPPSERCSQVEIIVASGFEVDELDKSKVPLNFTLVNEFMEVVVQILQNYTKLTWSKSLAKFISKFTLVNFESDQRFEYQRFVCFAVKLIRQRGERTVLIDALSCWLENDRRIDELLSGVTARLECGADVNEIDQDNNNVVHFLFEFSNCNNLKLRQFAPTFVEYGIHLDARNCRGIKTSECLERFGMRITPPINLMCIAARGIRRHGITVQGILPKFLIDFVEMH